MGVETRMGPKEIVTVGAGCRELILPWVAGLWEPVRVP